MVTATLIPVESSRAVVGATVRKAVDIIVPVYKSVHLTTRCLNSLADHIQEIASSNPRLIIINDSPGEPDVHRLLVEFERRHSYVTVLENECNVGFVKSVNKGLEIACRAGRDVILVNADTETFDDTLQNLVSAVYSDPQIGFASPRSNNASFCSLPHFYGGVVANQAEAYQRWQVLSRTMPAFHFVPTAVGFYLYIKNEVIANFGFLDPEFGLGYEEENDLILRANKAGYRAVLVNNAFAYHAGSASFNLLEMNLKAHQGANLRKMAQRHAEYLPLVGRYEASAHFRAERLLSAILPSASGRLKIVFDLSAVGPHFNGTNEMSVAIIDAFHDRHASTFDISVICAQDAFEFHRLDRHQGLRRHDADLRTLERFAIGIQLGQPFSVHAISVLEDLAVINVFGMLDTIAEDCGYLSITHQLEMLWSHVARHANGLFFNSRYSEGVFLARYPDAHCLSRYPQLLPTKLSTYVKATKGTSADHVLIMGNHFAHKASDATAAILRAAFPTVQIVVLGAQNGVTGNVQSYRSGSLTDKQMESLYNRASVVLLPSHVEGFGFGLVHALAAGKVVVARDIPATREILATYGRVEGVFLYANDGDLVKTLRTAMRAESSSAEDAAAHTWDDWVDGFADFCSRLVTEEKLFGRIVNRIQAGDLIRRSELLERLQASASVTHSVVTSTTVANDDTDVLGFKDEHGRRWSPTNHLSELLALDGEEFIYRAYVTALNRIPDSNGLVNYLSELQSGVEKFDIVSRLRRSTEGRKLSRPLRGYRLMLFRRKMRFLWA